MKQKRRASFLLLLPALFWAGCQEPDGQTLESREAPRGIRGELSQLYRFGDLPLYRTGSVVAQISSYDTTGGNNDGFSGLYSFVRREGEHLVLAELEGPGVVHRFWTPTPTEAMVAFYFDGEETPRLRLPFIDLFSGDVEPFLKPLVGNEIGGYFSYFPIPYASSLKIVYEGEDIRFHQIQYRSYPPGTEVQSFRVPLSGEEEAELARVLSSWDRSGERPWGEALPASILEEERSFTLTPGGSATLFRKGGGGRILGLEVERDGGGGSWGRNVILEAVWDGQMEPAIRAPVEDFFGYAYGRPSAMSLLLGSTGERDYTYLPMPFHGSAEVRLRGLEGLDHTISGRARIFYTSISRDMDREGQLFAQWRRETPPPVGEPYLLLEAPGRGHHAGTLLQAQGQEAGMTVFFEGDDVTTVDGEMRLHGTGSEDYFNGGWYALLDRWDGGVSLPLHGSLDYTLPLSRTGGYRFYLADKVSFEEHYRLTIEHGPDGNQTLVDYTSVAFYYGDTPPLHSTDPVSRTDPVSAPREHVFYPQLLSVALRGGTTLDYQSRRYLEIRAEGDGLARLDLSELPPGRYRVFLSYEKGPLGADFSLWRRQVQLSDWMGSYSADIEEVQRAFMGEVTLTDQIRSLTIRIRGEGVRQAFRFTRLFLEEG